MYHQKAVRILAVQAGFLAVLLKAHHAVVLHAALCLLLWSVLVTHPVFSLVALHLKALPAAHHIFQTPNLPAPAAAYQAALVALHIVQAFILAQRVFLHLVCLLAASLQAML